MRFFTLIFSMFLAVAIQAQSTITDGYISYSVSIDSDEPAAALLGVGTSLEIAFKGSYTKAVAKAAGSTVSIVADHKKEMGLALGDILGEKKALKLTPKEFSKAKEDLNKSGDNPMRFTDDTKTIAGYTCKKILMKDKESGANIIIYVTDKINPKNDPFAQALKADLKGFPLGIVVRKDGTTVRVTADKVTRQTPSSGAFSLNVPSEYEVVTLDELEEDAKDRIEKNR